MSHLVSTNTSSLSIPTPYNCSHLPQGVWNLGSFATYAERQINPDQKDLTLFQVAKVVGNFVQGFAKATNHTKLFDWHAFCKPKMYQGYHELLLNITAPVESGINNCSGIFSFTKTPYASVMYLGGPSLATGDQNYTLCEGRRYGLVYPLNSLEEKTSHSRLT